MQQVPALSGLSEWERPCPILPGPPAFWEPFRKNCLQPAYWVPNNESLAQSPRALNPNQNLQTNRFAHRWDVAQRNLTASDPLVCRDDLFLDPVVTTGIEDDYQEWLPLKIHNSVTVNCPSALKGIWACDGYMASNNLDGYNKCRALESCFRYDLVHPDGSPILAAVKSNPVCRAAAKAAFFQAGRNCTPCTIQTKDYYQPVQ